MDQSDPVSVKVEQLKTDPVPVKQILTGSWKEMGARWLFEQGFTGVLLISIVFLLGYGVPTWVVPTIKEGYRSNSESLEKTSKLYVDAFKDAAEIQATARERELKLIMDSHERDRDVLQRAVDALERRP